jgi:hypothetical protein
MRRFRITRILIAVFALTLTAGSLLHATPFGTTSTDNRGAAGSGMAARHFPADFRLDRETTVLTRPEMSSPAQAVSPMQSDSVTPPDLGDFLPVIAKSSQAKPLRLHALRI